MAGQRADDTVESGETAFADLKRRVIHGEEALIKIDTQLERLNNSIIDLNKTIADIGKPDYKTWGAFGALFFAVISGACWLVWTLALTPINDRIAELKTDKAAASSIVQLDKDIARLENDIKARATKDDLNQKVFELIQRKK